MSFDLLHQSAYIQPRHSFYVIRSDEAFGLGADNFFGRERRSDYPFFRSVTVADSAYVEITILDYRLNRVGRNSDQLLLMG